MVMPTWLFECIERPRPKISQIRASSIDRDLTLDVSRLSFIDVVGAREILLVCSAAQRRGHQIPSPPRRARYAASWT